MGFLVAVSQQSESGRVPRHLTTGAGLS